MNSRVTLLGLLKLQLTLAPLCCSWFCIAALAQEREFPNSAPSSFIVGLASAALFYATVLTALRVRACPNDSLFVDALKHAVWYSLAFGVLAWSPSLVMDVTHSFSGFVPKLIWLLRRGEIDLLAGCRVILSGFWTEFQRPLLALWFASAFYGCIGLITAVCATAVVQLAQMLSARQLSFSCRDKTRQC